MCEIGAGKREDGGGEARREGGVQAEADGDVDDEEGGEDGEGGLEVYEVRVVDAEDGERRGALWVDARRFRGGGSVLDGERQEGK